MERRNWSLEVYNNLVYIDSLDSDEKGKSLELWVEQYLDDDFLDKLDLKYQELKNFTELFYKTIEFLKSSQNELSIELNKNKNIKKFFLI
jgi:hypothetical protein